MNIQKKFSDEEYIKLYRNGLTDRRASKILNCGISTIRHRRCKLGLIANNFSISGKRKDKNELLRENKEQIKLSNRKKQSRDRNVRNSYIKEEIKWLEELWNIVDLETRNRKDEKHIKNLIEKRIIEIKSKFEEK